MKRSSHNGGRKSDTPLKKIVISGLSIQEKVELHSAENAWKPRPIKDKRVTENGEADDNEELARKARSILNKLTPQKFDTLVQKFQELMIDNEEKLRLCMELIFEKVDNICQSVAQIFYFQCFWLSRLWMSPVSQLLMQECVASYRRNKSQRRITRQSISNTCC